MPAFTSPFTAVTNTVISSADFNASVRDNINFFRQYLSADPGGAGRLLVSSGATAAGWSAVADPTLLTTLKVQAATPLATGFPALQVANGSGFFEVSPGSGGPTGSGTWYVINIVETNQPTTYGMQLAVNINDVSDIYVHITVAGTPGVWQKIWTAGNDGSGSGLDADLLDGQSIAYFGTAAVDAAEAATRAAADTAEATARIAGDAAEAATRAAADTAEATARAAIVAFPLQGVVFFETLAQLTAAGANFARYTAADGRLLVGAGTTFSQTFVEATNYGANWTPFTGYSGSATASGDTLQNFTVSGGTSTLIYTHTHPVSIAAQTWLPVARAGIWGRRTS